MEPSEQYEENELLKLVEEGTSTQLERNDDGDAEKISTTKKCDTSKAKMPTNQPENVRGWATRPYANMHECLEDPKGLLLQQPMDADWTYFDFPSKEVVQLGIEYLVKNKRIIIVDGEYQM